MMKNDATKRKQENLGKYFLTLTAISTSFVIGVNHHSSDVLLDTSLTSDLQP